MNNKLSAWLKHLVQSALQYCNLNFSILVFVFVVKHSQSQPHSARFKKKVSVSNLNTPEQGDPWHCHRQDWTRCSFILNISRVISFEQFNGHFDAQTVVLLKQSGKSLCCILGPPCSFLPSMSKNLKIPTLHKGRLPQKKFFRT